MSMICWLQEIDQATFQELSADPEQFIDYIEEAQSSNEDEHETSEGTAFVCVHKAWHGIHYLLTGTTDGGNEPNCLLTEGGEDVNGLDFGYGPGRMLSQNQVAQFANLVCELSKEQLGSRFDGAAMMKADIYPGIWNRGEEEAFDWLWECFQELRDFLKKARDDGKGALVWLS